MFPRKVLIPRVPEQLLSFPATIGSLGAGATLCRTCPPLAALRKDERSPLQTTSSLEQGPSVSHGTDPAQPRDTCAATLLCALHRGPNVVQSWCCLGGKL